MCHPPKMRDSKVQRNNDKENGDWPVTARSRNSRHHKLLNASPQSIVFWIAICVVLYAEISRMNNVDDRLFRLPSSSSSSLSSSSFTFKSKPQREAKNELETEKVDTGSYSPKIAWLMSFPNSGTSYTSQFIKHTTHLKTASNYGEDNLDENGVAVPVFTSATNGIVSTDWNGPYWADPSQTTSNYKEPNKFILVKTHCGGRCAHCGPKSFLETTYSFKRKCLSTKAFVPAHNVYTIDGRALIKNLQNGHVPVADNTTTTNIIANGQYDSSLVKKAIHLYRNPFDNIVSRFHLSIFKYNIDITDKDKRSSNVMRSEFRAYCHELDRKYESEIYRFAHIFNSIEDNVTLDEVKEVPCFIDFFRYMEWHNLAHITALDLNVDTYVLNYENYEHNRINQTAKELMDFLEYPPIDTSLIPPFVPGKKYATEYFTEKDRLLIKNVLESIALKSTWMRIKHYFD